MTKIITDAEWGELWEENRQNGNIFYKSSALETIYQGYLPDIGNEYDSYIKLRNGLNICIYECKFTDDLVWHKDINDNYQFGLSFFLSGKVKIHRHGLTDETEELVGRYYSECNGEIKETEWWQAGEKISRIYIGFKPQEFFQSFGEELLQQIPVEMRQGMANNRPQPYYYLGKTTRKMQQALHEILQCPYQGLMKQMYLESRAVNLIALHLQQFQDNSFCQKNSFPKSLSDVERIHQAKEILLRNLENPPSLVELAQLVGLNDFKLKRGFRQVFGTSAFKYLHDYRLEQAQQLLATGDMKVEEVASRVGFESRSYFAIAFRKKFGINPKKYQPNC
ncbi:MAG: helix-turn-helix transcriptional regulator [Hydrococcus sp. RU_2_2]|nr:helix-turn-helix transcriptional regulator [Hydrococcus sp. RU_2_2]NJP20515.1 helix-turn-helix transcriptional regulator [Hydrococcus sp. CRU_1_1]